MVHILLLRGINVSGQKKITMAGLRAETEKLGFHPVITYIQSGNILLMSKPYKGVEVAGMIRKMIMDVYGFDVCVFALTLPELLQAVANNPFRTMDEEKELRSYFVFLAGTPDMGRITALQQTDFSPEEFFLVNNILYMHSPQGYGKARLSNNFIEGKLKVKATTRNRNTVIRLITLAEELEASTYKD